MSSFSCDSVRSTPAEGATADRIKRFLERLPEPFRVQGHFAENKYFFFNLKKNI